MNKLSAAFNRLGISQRLLTSICFFSLPLGVLFYFNIDQLSQKIDFARLEIAGNQYQRPAIRLVNALATYRIAALMGQGVPDSSAAHEVETDIHQLEDANGSVGAKLAFTDAALKDAGLSNLSVANIKSDWEALQHAPNDPTSKSYEQIVGDIRGLVSHAGDTSNLTLDPQADSYYLSDVTSVTVVQSLDRIGSSMAALEPLMKRGKLSAADRTQAAIYNAMLKESDFDRITGDLDTAFKENLKSARGKSPTLQANLEPLAAKYKKDVQALIDLLAATGQGKTVSQEEFHRVAEKADQSTANLWEAGITELDALLVTRIDGFTRYRTKLAAGTFLSLALALSVLFYVLRGVTRPLAVVITNAEYVAKGDLSRNLPADYMDRLDEIGMLARAMQTMSTALRSMVKEISEGVEVLSSSATLLQGNAAQMTSESKNASDKAHSVAAAAEQMSSNVISVAAGMEQATANLSNVSAATSRMSSTLVEIAGNSEKARGITQVATQQAERITEQINQLSESAREIGKVSESINEISSQTNLLALNATIEAARAGSAGKGFAVVATEIKALAKQTAAATEDIKTRVAGVQNSTARGIAEIEKVASVIHDVSEIVRAIAAAIEQQASSTHDIANNIAEASIGVNEANERVADSSAVSREIARDIGMVDHAASEIAQGSGSVRLSAADVTRISSQLRLTLARFAA